MKFKFFAIFSAFTFFWLGIRYELVNSMDLGFKTNWSIVWFSQGGGGYPQNTGILVVLVINWSRQLRVFRSLMSLLLPSGLSMLSYLHDDVIKWKHFPCHWPFVWGIHRSKVNSTHKDQWRGALMFSLICIWINGWINNCGAGDLRRNQAHYVVIVMIQCRRLLISFIASVPVHMSSYVPNHITTGSLCRFNYWPKVWFWLGYAQYHGADWYLNGHTQPVFAFSNVGHTRLLSFS